MKVRGSRAGLLILFLIVVPWAVRLPAEPIELLFFGDIMLGRRIDALIADRGVSHFFDGVRSLPDGRSLHEIDLVSANLEGAITPGGATAPPVYPYDFAFPPEWIVRLRDEGLSFVTIANNHLFDQGTEGVVSTRRYLDEIGIDHSGDLDRVVSAHSTRIVERDGVTLGMVGLSEVYNPLDRDEVRAIVTATARSADFTIVNIHWGVEYEHIPRTHQRDMAIILARAGADLVIGHHPHVTQGVEIVEGTPVFYSLGNFIFDQAFSPEVQEGIAVIAAVYRDGTAPAQHGAITIALEILPYRATGYVPSWHRGEERVDRLRQIAEWSFGDEPFRSAVAEGAFSVGAE